MRVYFSGNLPAGGDMIVGNHKAIVVIEDYRCRRSIDVCRRQTLHNYRSRRRRRRHPAQILSLWRYYNCDKLLEILKWPVPDNSYGRRMAGPRWFTQTQALHRRDIGGIGLQCLRLCVWMIIEWGAISAAHHFILFFIN